MNIVYFSHYGGKGGANIELVMLVQEMIRRGHKAIIVMPEKGWLYDTLNEQCRCIVLRYHRWVENNDKNCTIYRKATKWLINWGAAVKIKILLKDEKVDLVHTNDSITVVGAYTAMLLNVPHIWHMREIFDGQFGFKHTYSEGYCDKWMKRASCIVAISNAVEERYKLYDGLKIKRIYDGLLVPKCKFERNNSRRLELLFCGGTALHKGFQDVLELAKRLQKEGIDFHISIVSSYCIDDNLKQDLKEFSLENRMSFLGFVDNVEELRQKSNVLLMCSKDEAFGLVTVEGMLSKILVVGRKSGATVELIKDGLTGFLYEDIDEFVSIIKKVREYDNSVIVEQAYKYAVKHFSITSTADNMLRVYEEAVRYE